MQLTGEQINEFLSNAILQSHIGDAVKEAVKRSITDLSKSYNNPFDQVIKNEVVRLIANEVQTTYQPLLAAGIKEAMEKAMTEGLASSIISAAIEKMNRSNY